jgi:hypothetical protein
MLLQYHTKWHHTKERIIHLILGIHLTITLGNSAITTLDAFILKQKQLVKKLDFTLPFNKVEILMLILM